MRTSFSFAILFLVLIAGLSETMAATSADVSQTLEQYFDAVMKADWESAQKYWKNELVEKSNRFGIEFTGIEAKYDCASPLIYSLDRIHTGDIKFKIKGISKRANYFVAEVEFAGNFDTLDYDYYLDNSDGVLKISSPVYLLTSGWNKITTKYVNLYYDDSTLINQVAIDELDRFMDDTAEKLHINSALLEQLKTKKLDYFLCRPDEIKLLTGYETNGLAILPYDAIVTRHLPHYHELVHFLINLSHQKTPLYTLPFMQEGLAVAWGGRWGKSPEVALQLCPTVISQGLCQLEDILTRDGFNRELPDITYPVAGAFVRMFIKDYGFESLDDAYMKFSGMSDMVNELTRVEIITQLEEVTGDNWTGIINNFDSYISTLESSGIIPGIADLGDFVTQIDSDSTVLKLYETDLFYEFSIKSNKKFPSGVILIKNPMALIDKNYDSWMFDEQLPDKKYEDYIYGIKYDINEAGLYNYPLNILEAKYVAAFSPDDSYYDSASSVINFKIIKSLFNYDLKTGTISLPD